MGVGWDRGGGGGSQKRERRVRRRRSTVVPPGVSISFSAVVHMRRGKLNTARCL